MWIRSQDKKRLGQYSHVYVDISSQGKINICGKGINYGGFECDDVLGAYKIEEDAIKEIDNLQNEIFIKKSKIYEMK